MNLAEARDTISIFHGPPLPILSDCLRGYLCAAPGNKLISGDFSSVEARVLAWLAGQEDVLQIFRTHGMIYEDAANKIYGVPMNKVTPFQRLIGKVSILALGYQGGVGAFQSMAKAYLVKIEDELAEDIKTKWRDGNPYIVAYWRDIENAAIAAIHNPGQKFHVGSRGRHVTYMRKGSFLMCRLPSGRVIFYPYPEMRLVRTPWGEKKNALTYKGEKDRRWQRIAAYGGLLVENITQAVARDLLRDAMHRWERHGYPVVMHVHDELVAEVRKNDTSKTLKEALELLTVNPAWAENLPIAADGWEGKRFRK